MIAYEQKWESLALQEKFILSLSPLDKIRSQVMIATV